VSADITYKIFMPLVDAIHLELGPGEEEGDVVEHSFLFRGSDTDKQKASCPRALHLDCLVVSLDKPDIEIQQHSQNPTVWFIDQYETILSVSQAPVDSIVDKFLDRSWELLLLGLEKWLHGGHTLVLMVIEHQTESVSCIGTLEIKRISLEHLKEFAHVEKRRVRLV
jgi:hypothetical protein